MKNMISKYIGRLRRGSADGERGDSLVIVGLLLTTFIVVTAFTVDFGMAYMKIAEGQNVADAAALAGGTLLPVAKGDTAAVDELYDTIIEYAAKNGVSTMTRGDIELVETDGYYTKLSVVCPITSKTYFAKIIGIDQLSAVRTATVGSYAAGSVSGAVPIGIEQSVFQAAISSGNAQHITLKYGGGGGTNGEYGYVFLDGSANGGADIIRDWMLEGFNGTNYVGQELFLRTGNINNAAARGYALRRELCTHVVNGEKCCVDHYVDGCPLIVYVLVYEDRTEVNRGIRIAGFAPFILEGCTNDGEITGSYVNVIIPESKTNGTFFTGATSISLSD